MPIENDKPAIVQLHQAMRDIAWGDTQTIRRAATGARRLLRQGADPNGIVEGQTPLTRLLVSVPAHVDAKRQLECTRQALDGMETVRHNERLKMLDTLLDAGADPWKGRNSTWNTRNLPELHYLLIKMFEREEKGQVMRGPDGGNPLHSLDWSHLSTVRTYGLLLQRDHSKGGASVWKWMIEANDAGDLPIHCLWKQTSRLPAHQVDDFCQIALWATHQFCKLSKGAPLAQEEIPSILGVRGAHGNLIGTLALARADIVQAIEQEEQKEGIPWHAFLQASTLEGDTLSAGPGRARVRL